MPISKKDFLSGNFKKRENLVMTLRGRILRFLKINKLKAYNANELHKLLKLGKWSIRNALKNLTKHKLLTHKKPYYIYNNRK